MKNDLLKGRTVARSEQRHLIELQILPSRLECIAGKVFPRTCLKHNISRTPCNLFQKLLVIYHTHRTNGFIFFCRVNRKSGILYRIYRQIFFLYDTGT